MPDYVSKYTGPEIEKLLDYAADIPEVKNRLTTTETDISKIKSEAQSTSESIGKLTENNALLKQQLDVVKKDTETISSDMKAVQELGLFIKDGVVYDTWEE